MDRLFRMFDRVWCWDSEFVTVPGWHVIPVCMAALELRSGQSVSLALDHEGQMASNPLSFGPDDLHILYSATADLGFALAMRWGLPCNVLDLWVERRNLTNGLVDAQGYPFDTSLIATCQAYGIPDTTGAEEKDANRERILRGHPFSNEEMSRITAYCARDVRMLGGLALKMAPRIGNLEQALHRGRCQKAMACVEWNGVPADTSMLARLNAHAKAVRRSVVQAFEAEYRAGIHTFDKRGDPHFSNRGYKSWVRGALGFDERAWPSTEAGWPSADDKEVLEPMAAAYSHKLPVIGEYRQLRKFLSVARSEFKFPVGPDGRNRTRIMPFRALTGRSQPSTAESISNAAKALRPLIAPHEAGVFIHRDWSNAEYGIAAALSGDRKRWGHYLHRDVYLVKAADFGFCDYSATKETHRGLRNKFKPVVLAGQYGQTAKGLARILDISASQAKAYQQREARLYPVYQEWLSGNEESRAENGYVETELGWRLYVPITAATSRSTAGHLIRRAMNLPMQGNCNEIMRYALCLATERGIDVGSTCHDAFDYTAPAGSWQDADAAMKSCMDEASQVVLGDGYVLKSDVEAVHWPGRYMPEDGAKMWQRIEAAVEAVRGSEKEQQF